MNLPLDMPVILARIRQLLLRERYSLALAEIEYAMKVINDEIRREDELQEIAFGDDDPE